MQLDGVGGIAVIAYQIVCAGIATGKVGQQGCIHTFTRWVPHAATAHKIRCHRRDNRHIRAAMSCRPGPEGWEWWAFSYIKSCRSPASLCHAGLHFQLCNIFFRSDTEVVVNSTLRPSFCTVATRLPCHQVMQCRTGSGKFFLSRHSSSPDKARA